MRGLNQEFKRIPHSFKDGVDPVTGPWKQVTLHPDKSEDVVCARGKTLALALDNALAELRTNFPGATL